MATVTIELSGPQAEIRRICDLAEEMVKKGRISSASFVASDMPMPQWRPPTESATVARAVADAINDGLLRDLPSAPSAPLFSPEQEARIREIAVEAVARKAHSDTIARAVRDTLSDGYFDALDRATSSIIDRLNALDAAEASHE